MAKEEFEKESNPVKTPVPPETSSVTKGIVQIGDQSIEYTANAATMLLKNEKDEPAAQIFYTAYTKTGVSDPSQRPIAFIYNGGPGSSSIWLHMGAFGPRRIVTADAEPTPPPPYQTVDNAQSLLDKADLVFIDPVGTGFSRTVGVGKDKDFWGVEQDVNSISQFITRYVSQNDRWNSPKFLIGESYGTFRSAALGKNLQTKGMNLNGIVLISSVLDMGQLYFPPGQDNSYIFYVPSYAATAWHHDRIKDKPADLETFLQEAREFSAGEYATALMKGAKLGETEKAEIARKLSHFTGLGEDYLIKSHLRVTLPKFLAELQRSGGLITARMDSRFSGLTYDVLNSAAYDDPQMSAIDGAFTAAFNSYARNDLKVSPDRDYIVLNYKANGSWDWKQKGRPNGGVTSNVMDDLAQAMTTNPHLQIEVENGYYDMATPFFASEYTMDHLPLPDSLRKNIEMKYYEAGHMMYLREADLAKLKTNIAAFIDRAAPPRRDPSPRSGPA